MGSLLKRTASLPRSILALCGLVPPAAAIPDKPTNVHQAHAQCVVGAYTNARRRAGKAHA